MTHPIDDELEAMAVKFEQDHWFDAAAMLRACKSGKGKCFFEQFDDDANDILDEIHAEKLAALKKGSPQ